MPWLHQILSFAPFMACVFSAEPAGLPDDQRPPGCHCPNLVPRLECQPTGSGRQRHTTAGLWCRAGLGSRTPVDVFCFETRFAWGKFLCRGWIEKTLFQSDPYLHFSISLSHRHTLVTHMARGRHFRLVEVVRDCCSMHAVWVWWFLMVRMFLDAQAYGNKSFPHCVVFAFCCSHHILP